MSDPNQKRKPQAVRPTQTLKEKDIFVPPETRPGLKASKKSLFRAYLNSTFTCWSLCTSPG